MSRRNKKQRKHPKLRLAIKIFLLVFLLLILAAMVIFYFKYGSTLLKWQADAKEAVQDSTLETFKSSETSMLYSSNGDAIAKLKGDKDSYYLTFDQIPQSVKDAFVVTEDRDFYSHAGYDPKALVSAGGQLVISKLKGDGVSRGGSTITQQLARGIWLNTDKTYTRKIKEIFLAVELEKKYTKDQILEFYINNVYFSNGYYGIEAAAKGYFSKSASKLTLSEAAFLCSIPNRPTLYDPYEHFDNTISRKKRILKQMLDQGTIDNTVYSDAYYSDVVLVPAEDIKTKDYMTTYAVSCAAKALMEQQGFKFRYKFINDGDRAAYDKAYSQEYDECYKSLYTSGYKIYTSLKKKVQKELQTAVSQQLAQFTEKTKAGVFKMQGAATCIDNRTGRVVAIVGGRHQKNSTGYTLNRGYLSYRQPGSCFKPLVVYTPMLERGYTADSIVDDTYFEGGPKNSSGTYAGKITLRSAVENSKNVVAWRLFEELTPTKGLEYVLNMNFSKIVSNDYYPAASLGGLTNGVSTVEMASGFATLANNGAFREPTCITKIVDSEGNVVVNTKKTIKEKQVYKESAASAMTDILQGVLIRGTAAGHALNNMACAGKTGTTSDKKDGWFCGYTPYYSTAVWVGYDTPQTVDNLYGGTYPLNIWEQFMTQLHSGLEYKSFTSSTDSGDYNYDDTIGSQEEAVTTVAPKATKNPDQEIVEPTEEPSLAPIDEAEPTEQPVITEAPVKTAKPKDEGDVDTTDEHVN